MAEQEINKYNTRTLNYDISACAEPSDQDLEKLAVELRSNLDNPVITGERREGFLRDSRRLAFEQMMRAGYAPAEIAEAIRLQREAEQQGKLAKQVIEMASV